MTVGGTGDVLAGLTGSLFSRNPAFLRQPVLHILMGQPGIWLLKAGNGLLATDVIEKIPEVIKEAEIG